MQHTTGECRGQICSHMLKILCMGEGPHLSGFRLLCNDCFSVGSNITCIWTYSQYQWKWYTCKQRTKQLNSVHWKSHGRKKAVAFWSVSSSSMKAQYAREWAQKHSGQNGFESYFGKSRFIFEYVLQLASKKTQNIFLFVLTTFDQMFYFFNCLIKNTPALYLWYWVNY